MAANIGDLVRKGELLAEIDPSVLQAQLSQARAQAAQAGAVAQGAVVGLPVQTQANNAAVETGLVPTAAERAGIFTGLADAAGTGGLLVTCRYPLPGPDRFLARRGIGPVVLSAYQLGAAPVLLATALGVTSAPTPGQGLQAQSARKSRITGIARSVFCS